MVIGRKYEVRPDRSGVAGLSVDRDGWGGELDKAGVSRISWAAGGSGVD